MQWLKREIGFSSPQKARPRFKGSIAARYILSGLAICLISLLLVSLISYWVSYRITATQSNLRIEETALKNSAELGAWFEQQSGVIANMAQDLEINGDFRQAFLYHFLKDKLAIYEKDVLDYYIGFEDPARKLVSGTNWNPPADYDCRIRIWYRLAWKTDGVVFSTPYIDAQTGEKVITIAKVIRSNGTRLGVLAADIYLNKVFRIVGNYRLNGSSYNFLLDNLGNILVHPKKEFQPSANGLKNIYHLSGADYAKLTGVIQAERKRRAAAVQVVETRDYDGNWKYFIISKIPSCGWYFGIAILRSQYQKPLNYLLYGYVFAFLASMLAGLAIMFKLIGGMIRPIQSLSATVKNFTADSMAVRSEIRSDDELGELGRNFNQMADTIQEYSASLENKVAQRTRELQEKNDNIMESINYAEQLQRAILPPLAQRLGIPDSDCFVVWKPRDLVGGDMYWCRSDARHALLVVADCTGHGVPGALMTMALSSILDGTPPPAAGMKPAQILDQIHLRLQAILRQDRAAPLRGSLTNDGADVAVCLFDREKRRLLFGGAKLSLFVAAKGRIAEYKGARFSVGYAWRKEPVFTDQPVVWKPGSVCYITTDGLLDQNSQPGKGGLGRTAFVNFLASLQEQPLPQQREAVEALIAARLARAEQRDDILVIGFRF